MCWSFLFSVVVTMLWMSSLTFSTCLLSLSPQGCLYLVLPLNHTNSCVSASNSTTLYIRSPWLSQKPLLHQFVLLFPRYPTSASFPPTPSSIPAPLFVLINILDSIFYPDINHLDIDASQRGNASSPNLSLASKQTSLTRLKQDFHVPSSPRGSESHLAALLSSY